jgi:diguanylate cyclase (GGDEF)-like protein
MTMSRSDPQAPAAPRFAKLPAAGRALVMTVAGLAAAAAATAPLWATADPALDWVLLAITAAFCAVSAFEVMAAGAHSLHSNLVFFFCGAVLLPAPAIPVLALVCFVPGALSRRDRWYLPAFNAANYTLAGLAAHAVAGTGTTLRADGALDGATVAALGAAAIVWVLVNHLLIGLAVAFAQGRGVRAGVRELAGTLPLDLALAATGACVAALWHDAPGVAVLAAGPVALMYRALLVPSLRHQSRTDPKTALYNSEELERRLRAALHAARKRGEAVSLLMVDLDHLRSVNNRFGHLVGDEAIRRVAEILRDEAGADGVAARFGGEEFCLMVPGAGAAGMRDRAERIRARVEETVWEHDGETVSVTLSGGLASFPEHGDSLRSLVQAADVALYDAKVSGRNRIRIGLPRDARRVIELPAAERSEREQSGARERFDDLPPLDVSVAAITGLPADPPAEDPAADERPATRRAIPWFSGILLAAALALGATSAHAQILDRPGLLIALVATMLGLDLVRIDLFERARISPASAPTLVVAYFFGPLGVLVAEGVIALKHVAWREPKVKLTFDLGALTLSGAAAAAVFSVLPSATTLELLLAGPAAGLAYYVVNVSLLSVVMAITEGASPLGVWRERLAWLTPHYVLYGAVAAALILVERRLGMPALAVFAIPVITLWLAQKQYVERSRASVAELRRRHDELQDANGRLERLLDEKRRLMQRMQRSYLSTITSLARTIEAKDPYTGGHTERVCRVSVLLGEELGLTPRQLQAVEVGAVIHDIGKIGVPDDILLKPGRLEPGEVAQMRRHPEISSYILGELDLPPIVKQMVRSHHERYDGNGYPDGLVAEEIPLAARILTVADALDAMTSSRTYRAARPLAEAIAEIEAMSGRQFCPSVVAALRACLDRDASLNGLYGTAAVEVAVA